MIALVAIAAVILAVLVAPVGVHIKYSDDFALWLSYAGIRFRIIPVKEKKNKPQKEKSRHNGKNQKTKLKLSFDDILQLVGTGVQAIKKLVRTLRIRRFKLAIVVSGEDAASAAINYGRVYGRLNVYHTGVTVFDDHKSNRRNIDACTCSCTKSHICSIGAAGSKAKANL